MSPVLLGVLGLEDVDDSDVDVAEHLLFHHSMAWFADVFDVLFWVGFEEFKDVLGHFFAEDGVEVLVFETDCCVLEFVFDVLDCFGADFTEKIGLLFGEDFVLVAFAGFLDSGLDESFKVELAELEASWAGDVLGDFDFEDVATVLEAVGVLVFTLVEAVGEGGVIVE